MDNGLWAFPALDEPWWIVPAFAMTILVAFFVGIAVWIVRRAARLEAETQFFEQRGVLALAQVTGIAETNMSVNENSLVQLNLHIEGPGIAPFDAQERVAASVVKMQMITSRNLAVLVDPATKKYQIDWKRSAFLCGMTPATFPIAEDHRSYDLSGQAGPLMEIMQVLKANDIPFDNRVDLYSNRVASQQVQAIVRRTASGQHLPPAPAASPPSVDAYSPQPPRPSAAQRLQELETLRATGALTESEYAAKRQQMIAEL